MHAIERPFRAVAIALLVSLAVAVASLAQWNTGTVVWHNGAVASTPPGSGATNTVFTYQYRPFGPHVAVYYETAAHVVEFAYPLSPATVLWDRAYLFNSSSTAWSGFQILLEGGDFVGWNVADPLQAVGVSPVVDFGFHPNDVSFLPLDHIGLQHFPQTSLFVLGSSAITRFNDLGTGFRDSQLNITFEEGVDPGESFVLWYNIIRSPGAAGASELTATYTPIPEPTTLALLALGALALTTCRRPTLACVGRVPKTRQ